MVTGAFRARHRKGHAPESDESLRLLEERIDRLEAELRERVQTLERIVTDRQEDLKRQFDHLEKAS